MNRITPDLLKASWRSWYGSDLRIVGPAWLQVLWTFVFSTAVGLGFLALGISLQAIGTGRWPSPSRLGFLLMVNLTIAYCVGSCIHILFAVFTRWLTPARIRAYGRQGKTLFFAGIPLLGTAIGWPLGAAIVSQSFTWWPFRSASTVAGAFLFATLVCFMFYLHFDAKARQFEAEQRATQAQLRLLQGQIEPHFLFNTLANVHALIGLEPARAKTMLGAFTDYLRGSLGTLRQETVPLSDELSLARAYLVVQQVRMEERLRIHIDVPDDLLATPVPPLLLQPLVENAIVHGLEPQLDGGCVSIRARREAHHLLLEVQDDGHGPQAGSPRPASSPSGHGLALGNLRERLQLAHGMQASLQVQGMHPGTRVQLRLPLSTPESDTDAAAKPLPLAG
jgi:hypothetical protein